LVFFFRCPRLPAWRSPFLRMSPRYLRTYFLSPDVVLFFPALGNFVFLADISVFPGRFVVFPIASSVAFRSFSDGFSRPFSNANLEFFSSRRASLCKYLAPIVDFQWDIVHTPSEMASFVPPPSGRARVLFQFPPNSVTTILRSPFSFETSSLQPPSPLAFCLSDGIRRSHFAFKSPPSAPRIAVTSVW